MTTALQESCHSSTSEFFEVQLHSGTTTTVEEEGVTGETSFRNSKSKKGECVGESPEWPEVSKGFGQIMKNKRENTSQRWKHSTIFQ